MEDQTKNTSVAFLQRKRRKCPKPLGTSVCHRWEYSGKEEFSSAVEIRREKDDEQGKNSILPRLADTSLKSELFLHPEGSVVQQVAERLVGPSEAAYGIMVRATQAAAFRTDVKLSPIVNSFGEPRVRFIIA
jgi:hypothetical protein